MIYISIADIKNIYRICIVSKYLDKYNKKIKSNKNYKHALLFYRIFRLWTSTCSSCRY